MAPKWAEMSSIKIGIRSLSIYGHNLGLKMTGQPLGFVIGDQCDTGYLDKSESGVSSSER